MRLLRLSSCMIVVTLSLAAIQPVGASTLSDTSEPVIVLLGDGELDSVGAGSGRLLWAAPSTSRSPNSFQSTHYLSPPIVVLPAVQSRIKSLSSTFTLDIAPRAGFVGDR